MNHPPPSSVTAGVVDTAGKLATGVTILVANLQPVSQYRWQIAAGISYSSGQFPTGVKDTGCK